MTAPTTLTSGRVAAIAAASIVLGLHLSVGAWFTFRDTGCCRGDDWTGREAALVLVIWAIGLVAIARLTITWGRWTASRTSHVVAASMLIATLGSMVAGRVRAEYLLNFTGGVAYMLGTLAYVHVVTAIVVGIPLFAFLRGGREHHLRAAGAGTVAAALLAPVVVANAFGRAAPLVLVVVVVAPVVVAWTLRRSERKPNRVVGWMIGALALGGTAALVPVIGLAAKPGGEDSFYSQPWLTFAGLSALWYALGIAAGPEAATTPQPVVDE